MRSHATEDGNFAFIIYRYDFCKIFAVKPKLLLFGKKSEASVGTFLYTRGVKAEN